MFPEIQDNKIVNEDLSVSELSRCSAFKNLYCCSRAGEMNFKTKTNQDRYYYDLAMFGISDFNMLAVFDGHGKEGHFVSSYLKKNLKSKHPIINYFLLFRNFS